MLDQNRSILSLHGYYIPGILHQFWLVFSYLFCQFALDFYSLTLTRGHEAKHLWHIMLFITSHTHGHPIVAIPSSPISGLHLWDLWLQISSWPDFELKIPCFSTVCPVFEIRKRWHDFSSSSCLSFIFHPSFPSHRKKPTKVNIIKWCHFYFIINFHCSCGMSTIILMM